MPLVVVLDRNGFCVEDVVAPWCPTCSHVCWCLAFSKLCVSDTLRGARAIVQGEDQHNMVHMSSKRWRRTVVQASSFVVQQREAHNVWCTLECVLCESPVLALAGWRTGVLAPACALSFTQ